MLSLIKSFLIILIISSTTIIGYTQNVNVDSLKAVFETNIPDTTRIKVGIALSNELRRSDSEGALYYNDIVLNLAEDKGYEKWFAIAKLTKIPLLAYNKQLKEAEVFAKEALSYFQKENDLKYSIVALNSLGIIQKTLNKYQDALETYELGIQAADKNNDLTTKAKLLINKGNVQQGLNNFIGASQSFFESLKILEAEEDVSGVALVQNNIGLLYRNQRDLDKALEYYELSLKQLVLINDRMGQINALINIADVHIARKNNKEALKKYEEVLLLAQKMGYIRFIITAKVIIATFLAEGKKNEEASLILNEVQDQIEGMRQKDIKNFYGARAIIAANQKNWSKALIYQKKSLAIARKSDNIEGISKELKQLSFLYKEDNNYKEAYKAFEEYNMLSDSVVNEGNLLQLKLKEAKYNFDKEQALQEAAFKNKELITDKRLRTRTFIALGLIFALLVAIGWGGTILKANRKEKEYNKSLELKVAERTADLNISNQNLEQANYELRTFNYIASHDIKEPIRNIGNYVGLIKRKVSDDHKEELKDYFETIKNSTKQLYTLIEDFAFYTTLSKNDDIKLEGINISEMVTTINLSLNNLIQERKGTILVHTFPMIQSSKSMLYVVLKNLIENGLKYNTSNTPTVTLSYNETATTHQILVTDNGVGIEKEYYGRIFEMFKKLDRNQKHTNSGIGLSVVLLIMKKLGGKVSLESELTKGSIFTLELPKS
jgi:signal transduction histidine kinase